MRAQSAAYFAKLWSAVAIEPPLWEGGECESQRRSILAQNKAPHPPSCQSGGFATRTPKLREMCLELRLYML